MRYGSTAVLGAAFLVALGALSEARFLHGGGAAPPVTYTGPGDITAFTAWYGFRAYTAAIAAAGTQPLANIKKTSNSHTCDVLPTTSGGVGNTANCSTGGDNAQDPHTFCTRATGTGSISGTTLTLTVGTFLLLDVIDDGGVHVTPGTQITAVNGGGSYTINRSQTVSSQSLIATDCIHNNFYDQTQNNACTNSGNPATCDIAYNGHGGVDVVNKNTIVFNCVAGSMCIQGAGDDTYLTTTNNGQYKYTPATGVASIMSMNSRQISNHGVVLVAPNGDQANQTMYLGSGAFLQTVGGTSGAAFAAYSDAVSLWHSTIGVLGSGSNQSSITIDGSTTAGTAVANTTTLPVTLLTNSDHSTAGMIVEGGWIDNVKWSAGTIASLYANQKAYWGTP